MLRRGKIYPALPGTEAQFLIHPAWHCPLAMNSRHKNTEKEFQSLLKT
jgi:hypothetical protein